MSVALVQPSRNDALRRQLVEQALAPDILLGMPHLTPTGLSQTWLLKELAHRHWLLLGQILGLSDADFRSADGGEVYAAICATSLRHAALERARANDILTISTKLTPAGSAHMASVHTLFVDGDRIGEIELLSTFVHRLEPGCNGSVARIRFPIQAVETPAKTNALAETVRSLRRGDLRALGSFDLEPARPLRDFRFRPAQSQDFNGAGLFYFANFLATCDRAVESWWGGLPGAVESHESYYLGNIEPDEMVTVQLLAQSPDGRRFHLAMLRKDGAVIFHHIIRLKSSNNATL